MVLRIENQSKTYHEIYHGIKHADILMRQSNKMRKSKCYVMDKESDSEKDPFPT